MWSQSTRTQFTVHLISELDHKRFEPKPTSRQFKHFYVAPVSEINTVLIFLM